MEIYKSLKKFWKKIYVDPRRHALMQKWGISLMKKFDEVMKEQGIPYTLVYGTLLGAVREHGFIKHDNDIDVAVWADSDVSGLQTALEKAGFKLRRRILVENGDFGKEETYWYNHVYIDIFYFYHNHDDIWNGTVFFNQPGCRNWSESERKAGGLKVVQLILPLRKETEYVPFETIQLPITTSALDFVEARYGENWRIPDPTFVYPKLGDVNYIERPDKLGLITRFK